jgi:hypothetical protein
MQGRKYKNDNSNQADATVLKQDQNTVKTKNEYIRIGVLLLIILVLAAISVLYISSHKGCSGVVYAAQRNSCFANYAVSTGNATMCYKISGDQAQNICLNNVALSTSNVSVCGSITNQSIMYGCVSNMSISTGNESKCSTLSSQQYASECEYSFAAAKKFNSTSYCNGISNSTLNSYCTSASTYLIAMSTGNATYCSELSTNPSVGMPASKLLGIYGLNVSTTNFDIFNALSNASDSDACYYSLAVKYSNPSLCANTYGSLTSICNLQSNSTAATKNKLNATQVESECIAAGTYGGALTTDSCYIGFAVSYHNDSYCSFISNSTIRNNCIVRVSNTTNSSS